MIRNYTLICFTALFTSCGLRVNYMGSTASPTSQVDVYVDAANIKKPFTVMGKGYVEERVLTKRAEEKIQVKAIEKAREKGADAILFEDYYLVGQQASVTTTTIDTVRTRVTGTASGPVMSSGRNILFLKYKD
jgi:hypothetical protein